MSHWKTLAMMAAVAALIVVLNEKGKLEVLGGKKALAAPATGG